MHMQPRWHYAGAGTQRQYNVGGCVCAGVCTSPMLCRRCAQPVTSRSVRLILGFHTVRTVPPRSHVSELRMVLLALSAFSTTDARMHAPFVRKASPFSASQYCLARNAHARPLRFTCFHRSSLKLARKATLPPPPPSTHAYASAPARAGTSAMRCQSPKFADHTAESPLSRPSLTIACISEMVSGPICSAALSRAYLCVGQGEQWKAWERATGGGQEAASREQRSGLRRSTSAGASPDGC
jgi:hypothetical protein